MKRPTFNQQVTACLVALGIAHVLGQVFHTGIFINIAWILYGLACILNPVWPESWFIYDPEKYKKGSRIAGGVCIFIGLMTRFGV